jgi:hypothetical protein
MDMDVQCMIINIQQKYAKQTMKQEQQYMQVSNKTEQ